MVAKTGTTTIGDLSKSLFEVRQGTATLGGGGSTIELAKTATSAATINLKGGKLTLGGNVNRTNLTPDPLSGGAAPVVNLTGGTLEFNNTVSSAAQLFKTDLINNGSTLVLKPNAVQRVDVGSSSPAAPANFDMESGAGILKLDRMRLPVRTGSMCPMERQSLAAVRLTSVTLLVTRRP